MQNRTESAALVAFLAVRLDEKERDRSDLCDVLGDKRDPDRVLREVEAVRAHIRMWETFAVNFAHVGETVFEFAKREALEDVLAADAAVWSDHPDYRQEWAR